MISSDKQRPHRRQGTLNWLWRKIGCQYMKWRLFQASEVGEEIRTMAQREKQSLHAWDYNWSFTYRIKKQRKLACKHLSKPFTFLMFPCWSHHMFSIEDSSKDKDSCGPLKNWKTIFSGTAEKLFFTVCIYIFKLKNAMKQTKAELGWTPNSMYKLPSSIQWKD